MLDVRCSFVSRPIKLATAEASGGLNPEPRTQNLDVYTEN
jgi:hypothetical protein